jgi:peroxiredoxin
MLIGAALAAGLAFAWLTDGRIRQVPDITLQSLQGEKIRLEQLHGKPLLVTFWATDCRGCRREMPLFSRLHNEFSGQGLEVIGIAVPWSRPDMILATTRDQNLPYRICLDLDGAAVSAFGDVSLTPTTFLIAPDGAIRYRKVGEMDEPKVRRLITSMLDRTVASQAAVSD